MREIDNNIEPINDYIDYRSKNDDEALVREFMSEFQKPTQPTAEVEAEEEPIEEEPEGGSFKRFAKDVARATIGEGGRAIVSGVTKGINEMLESVDDAAQWLNENVADLSKFQTEKKFKVPQPTFGVDGAESPKSITGNMVEDIAQFITGFGVAGKAMKGAKLLPKAGKARKLTQATIQAGLGDIAAFDEQEERLSNLIQSVPALRNPVTEFLETKEDDTTAQAKLRQFAEGAGLGIVGEGLVRTVGVIKKAKNARSSVESSLEKPAKKEVVEEPGLGKEAFSPLGDIEDNSFIIQKVKRSAEEVADLTPEEVAKLEKKKPSNVDELEINFARIDGPEDLKQAMQALANESKLFPSVKDARRGVRSNEATLSAAEDIDAFETLLNRRDGEALNAEQITASRNFYYKTTEKLMELAKKAASPDASDVDQYAFRKMVATHHAVQKEVLGARAEAGRALQAWSIPSTATPNEKLKGMEAILDSFGGADTSKDLARRLSEFGDGQLTLQQLQTVTERSASARTKDAIIEAWTAGLLTNPVTHVKNLSSNTLVTLMSATERYAQALFPDSEVTVAEANAFVMGILQSQKEAMSNAGRAFRTGQVGFGQSKVELPRVRATSRDILDLQGGATPFAYGMDYYGRVVNTSFKALAAGDEYSKTVLYNAQLKALATREGLSQGLKGDDLIDYVANMSAAPNKKLAQEARDFADYGTFTKELGRSGKNFQRILSQNPTLKFVIPFYKTPVNIFKFTYERTPVSMLHGEVKKEIAAGGTRKAAALAKIGIGSSVMTLAVDMAINGNVTGAGPSDRRTSAALRRTGWQPNSIKVGDKYYSYQGLEPVSTLFSFASNMAEIMSNYESYDIEAQNELDRISTATVLAISDATVNKTFLQGISNIMEALSDPDRFGSSYIQRTLSSFVPSGVAAVERAVNPQREYVTNLMDAYKARIPGFSKDVPKKRNVYGEIVQYRYPDEVGVDTTTSAIVSLFNPFYVSTKKDDPLDNYLLENGYSVNMPTKTLTFDNIRVNLSDYPEIYSRLIELRGQEVELIQYGGSNMKDALTDLVKGDIPQSIIFLSEFKDRDEKQEMIRSIVRDYQQEAKKVIREEFPVIDQLVLEGKLQQESERGF
jgi:hypothetical protein